MYCIGQENLNGFHGKPVPAAAKDAIIDELQKLVAQPSGIKLTPPKPVDDCTATNLSNVKLSSPPDYQLGQKVSRTPISSYSFVYLFSS